MKNPSLLPPDDALLQSVKDVYEQGRILDALRLAESFAPLKQWSGAKACVVAARLAMHAGNPRLALRLTVRARRAYPDDLEVLLQYAHEVKARRGTLAAWDLLCGWTEKGEAPALQKSELISLKAVCAAELRDFSTAEKLVSEAEAIAPRHPFVRIHRAQICERSDRVEDALAAAKEACALYKCPYCRLGIQTQAYILQLLGRDDEAISLLSEASSNLQCGTVSAQLYALLKEAERWAEADAALKRFVELSPLLDEAQRKWVCSQQVLLAYYQGDRAEAARLLATLDEGVFPKCFAARLADAPVEPERVRLDVVFVRQHFKTCAPATLAALGRFWGMPAEHLAMTAEICYDGTPSWMQRAWAEKNGWFVREFRVTPEHTLELISKGIPFAVSVVSETSAHMMAMIGFDQAQGTLLMRDPGQPYLVEMEAETFLKLYSPFGPHGIIFLPANKRHLLDGLALPDEAIYDLKYLFCTELTTHRRTQAAEILRQMEGQFPDYWVTWETRQQLASYDANVTEEIRCLDHLDTLFPKNATRLLQRLRCLGEAPREEKIRLLQPVCAEKGASPILHIELAKLLKDDARLLPLARTHLRLAISRYPVDSEILQLQADICWEAGEYGKATERYRFAANLDGFNEARFQSWFSACYRTRRTEEAIAYLQDRFARWGGQSELPALTLAWALAQLEQPARARDVLADAIRQRPQDGILLLRSASLVSRLGEHAEAERLLAEAKDKARRNDWLRTAAEIAEHRSDCAAALNFSRELLTIEAFALDAHYAIARLLMRLEGIAAVQAHLQAACAQFPYHCGLRRHLIENLRDGDPVAQEDAIRQLIHIAPADAWAHRELALFFANTAKRFDEAIAEATLSVTIAPRDTFSHSVLGHVYQLAEKPDDARNAFCRAIELSVDNTFAIHPLLQLAPTDNERKEVLDFVGKQLLRQVVLGDGLLAYQEQARTILDPQQLLQFLREAHRERPDLWHAWAALILQLNQAGELDEARDIALSATSRFPYRPELWYHLAQVYRLRNEREQEMDALKTVLRLSPAEFYSAHTLLHFQLEANDLSSAEDTLRIMQSHQPGNATLAIGIRLKLKQSAAYNPEADFETLCVSPDPNPWSLNTAFDILSDAKRHDVMRRVLKRILKTQSFNPQVPALFIRLLLQKRATLRATLFFLRLPEGEAQRRAALVLLEGLAQNRCHWTLRFLLSRRKTTFTQNDEVWGQVGYALCFQNRMRATAQWLADWHTRTNIQPWMLANLCIALRHLGRYDETNTVARYAIAKWNYMDGAATMHLYLALGCAHTGHVEAARDHLRQMDARPDTAPADPKLTVLARALVTFLETPPESRQHAFAGFKKCTEQHIAKGLSRDVRRTFRRTMRTVIREGGGWRARWYLMLKQNEGVVVGVAFLCWMLLMIVGAIKDNPIGVLGVVIFAWAVLRSRR